MTAMPFRGVDHVMVRVAAAEPLMQLFADTLRLPVSWPLQKTEFATYGWVTAGNTNLEFWAAANNDDLPQSVALPLFHGLALDPGHLPRSMALLAERGIACKPPRAFVTQTADGRDVVNFTNSVILDVSGPSCCIFFCEWGSEGTIFPWTDKLTASERQRREQTQLSDCGGGNLGITGLAEIRMRVPSIEAARNQWRALTGDVSGPIRLGRGIVLAFSKGEELHIESLVFGVQSLDAARRFLAERNLLEKDLGNEIALARGACSGLDFRFREEHALPRCEDD